MHSIAASDDYDQLLGCFDREQMLTLSMEAREVGHRCSDARPSQQRRTEAESATLGDPSALLSGSEPDSDLIEMTIRN